jgi:hypothetical protein
MKLIEETKSEWKQYKYQIIGATALVDCFLLFLIKQWGIVAGILAMTLVYDLILIYYYKWPSITSWIRRQFKGYGDKITMIVLSLILLKVFGLKTELGQVINVSYWLFGTVHHLFWDK